jgi:cytochrome c553
LLRTAATATDARLIEEKRFMKSRTTVVVFALAVGMHAAVQAAGDPSAGQAIASEKCQACHGLDGNSSDPQYPRLAGQYADYMVHSLSAYKSGARTNPIMSGFAAGLSEQDMEDVAAWFAGQSGLETPSSK